MRRTISERCPNSDLNDDIGCPQKWAYQEKIGSYLLRQPDTVSTVALLQIGLTIYRISLHQVRDLIRAARDRTGWSFPISVKIRLDPDLK